ncbi:hypothetical protein CpecG_0808 [Chlamydia pecorum MC/MarsBar]|nr:hypothetical protein CpecG_0808 [Chlamydia pecorum MC/MarsBar]ETF40360.1 hypothetical protein CpecA_0810 [Chlamydia pecorum IPTaLE]
MLIRRKYFSTPLPRKQWSFTVSWGGFFLQVHPSASPGA